MGANTAEIIAIRSSSHFSSCSSPCVLHSKLQTKLVSSLTVKTKMQIYYNTKYVHHLHIFLVNHLFCTTRYISTRKEKILVGNWKNKPRICNLHKRTNCSVIIFGQNTVPLAKILNFKIWWIFISQIY